MQAPKRAHDWVERLDASFTEWGETPFEWGEHDCALSVCNHIHAMTGVDVGAELRSTYSSPEAAASAIQALTGTGNTLEHAVEHITAAHGFAEVGVKLAHRGDVVLFDRPEGAALGIVHLNGRHAILTGPDGLYRLRVLDARRAWRVTY